MEELWKKLSDPEQKQVITKSCPKHWFIE
jgi:hypothetical protein